MLDTVKKNFFKINLPEITIAVILFTIIYINFNHKYWMFKNPNRIIGGDIVSYYAYLPATFIYHDIALVKPESYKKGMFWPDKTPIGKNAIKTSMGLAILYSPFFFMGHAYAIISGYDTSGFSPPYKFFLLFSSAFYLFIGLHFLRKTLKKYFSHAVTTITLISIVIGTNLLYYSSLEATMAHSYSFSLFAVFIYLAIRWHDKPNIANTVMAGLLAGLIVLIRPTNIIILLFFILWRVSSWKSFTERMIFFLKSYHLILIMVLAFFIVWVPQMLYWKYVSGQYLYFSYGNERFFFDNPQIINGLFSYRKGWLLYTPIMCFALAGIPFLYKKYREFFFPVLIFTVLNIYIILSWFCWWYGGGYSLRPFVDSYSLLAIPFAAFTVWALQRIKIIFSSALILLISLSIFQTLQYTYGIIHYDSMTKKAYWAVFGKMYHPKNLNNLLKAPDYKAALKGGHKEKNH